MNGHNGRPRKPLVGELARKPRVLLLPNSHVAGDCWWLLTRNGMYGNPHAYGTLALKDGRHVVAHRYSYAQAFGAFPDELCIHHRCFCKRCINPAHLEAVTCGENSRMSNLAERVRGNVEWRNAQVRAVSA